MKNEKTIKLFIYVDGVNDVPFYGSDAGEYEAFILANGEQYTTSDGFVFNVRNVNEQIEIGYFRYDAKRMGGAPTITCTLMYKDCLDDFWSENVYAEFNGEKYFLKQTPTSSYNNESTMYKHELELVSERVILDNVYFFDAVVGDPQGDDKPVSNSTKVVFFGNIHEFVKRLNSSLEYAKLLKWEDGVDEDGNAIKIPKGYHVVVDDDNNITKEEKLMSFEDQFFSNVLQEIYNTYEVPYYFEGKTIHIGYSNKNAVVPTFSYGVDDALLSITKNNDNYKIVNRATATGSSDNIPFYYPNNSPKGSLEAVENGQLGVKVLDFDTFANKVDIDGVITYQGEDATVTKVTNYRGDSIVSGSYYATSMFTYKGFTERYKMYVTSSVKGNVPITITPLLDFKKYSDSEDTVGVTASGKATIRIFLDGKLLDKSEVGSSGHTFNLALPSGSSVLEINLNYVPDYDSSLNWFDGSEGLAWATDSHAGWYYKDEEVELKDLGLAISDEATPSTGDSITQKLAKYVKTSQTLMPSIYRETDGDERFYNATNDTYEGVSFNNPYVEGRPKEHIFTVEDIKPTIKDTIVGGLRIDMFSEFAYDDDDNDETYEDEEGNVYFKHPYFYGKLRVMDFNLFDHAIEQQPMTISFTSGHCGACNFEIGVTEDYPQKNPVQVYEADTLIDGVLHKAGSLKRDENGMVLAGVEGTQQQVTTFQERQQDTSKYEVWIALRKEEDTYGVLMPQVAHRPKAAGSGNEGDTFVILGINLPQSYIINAEKKLEAEIVKYLQDNNDEKFTFSINFSRIYFEENDVLDQLNENSKIRIIYDNKPYDLYVSSFSYSMSEGDVLPEIRVELDDTLKVSQNALQNAISQVKSELGRAMGSIDIVGAATPYFLRKDADDEAQGRINFKKGIKFGEGGKVEVLDNNSAKLTIEYLEVTKKASFTSLEIQEKTHAGGQILVTPAAINCGEVEEFDDYYRCYFQTKGEDGDEIFNQFAVGDQAICQTFNAWGSKYYWRLVTGIGEDYIDLSKTDCDEGSDIPSAGDKIIQMGNRNDKARQNAIVIAAYGDGSPYIIQYKGINAFELSSDKIVTKLSSTENIFTGKVHMEMGSDGLGDLQEFIDLQVLAGKANTNAINAQNKANTAMSVADNAQQSADTANTNALQAGEAASVASEKAEEAIGKANAAQEGLDNMEVGGQNLLRNSGFTGDYLSEQLADESVLESAAELYSAPFDHWIVNNAIVQDSIESASGKEASLTNGRMEQTFSYNLVANESYVVSFKAKGMSLQVNVGGFSSTISLTDEWSKYEVSFTATTKPVSFVISNATCTLCDLKFERGNKSTSWSTSQLDNASDRAYYQALKYLSTAIKDGSTDILGGLVLTNTLLLKNALSQITAGANGVTTDSADDVAFWAGGTLTQANETIIKYLEDPTYKPTTEELAAMAKAVITHGGRAILNDAIIRGTIYARDGEFTGTVNATSGVFNDVDIQTGKIGGFQITNGRLGISQGEQKTGMFLYDVFIGFRDVSTYDIQEVMVGTNVNPSTSGTPAMIRTTIKSSNYDDTIFGKAEGIISEVSGFKESYAFSAPKGQFAGLRPKMVLVTSGSEPYDVKTDDHTIVTEADNIVIELKLPASPEIGQTYKIWKQGNHTLSINPNGNKILNMGIDVNNNKRTFGSNFFGTIELIYRSNQVWLMVYINNAALNG